MTATLQLIGAPTDVGGAVLYFQKPDKTIVTVYVNTIQRVIGENTVEIPRR